MDNYTMKIYRAGFEEGFKSGMEEYKVKINTPKKVILEPWQPSKCPTCKEDYSDYEPANDGYYKRAYSLLRCPYCGQKLKWEF